MPGALVEASVDLRMRILPRTLLAWRARLSGLRDDSAHIWRRPTGERLREGVKVAIVRCRPTPASRPPQRSARREAAIVSPIAGTTRDVIEVPLDLGGYPVILTDTGGPAEGNDHPSSRSELRALRPSRRG